MEKHETKLKKEIERVEELLKMYMEIPTGIFGATRIKTSLAKAYKATTDTEIKKALKDLQEIEG